MAELDRVAGQVARRLIERQETVAVAEAAAGGLISAALLAVPGASAYFRGGVVAYTGDSLQRLTGLTPEELATTRGATAPRSAQMARAIRERLGTTWGIGEGGAAGPTGNRYGDAPGHAALAISGPSEDTFVIETGQSDRQANMEAFAAAALRLLRDALARG